MPIARSPVWIGSGSCRALVVLDLPLLDAVVDVVFPRTDYFENSFRPYYPCINAPFVNPPYWSMSSGESLRARLTHGA